MRKNVAAVSCVLVLAVAAFVTLWFTQRRQATGTVDEPEGQTKTISSQHLPGVPAAAHDLPVRVAAFQDGLYPCNLDAKELILYKWKGVRIGKSDIKDTWYGGGMSGLDVLVADDFRVIAIEPPVQYLAVPGLGYLPGHHDTTINVFYTWKGRSLWSHELLLQNKLGRDPLLKIPAAGGTQPKVIEFEMPTYLRENEGLWRR